MKLNTRDAAAFFAAPDKDAAGILIFGADGDRVALRRRDLVDALLGPKAEAEMRLTRLTGADLRSDAARLLDAVKAVGFFPGTRAVVVEDATDGLAGVFETALRDWRPGDAQIVATAKSLTARSKLRKLFETDRRGVSIALYDDPPDRAEIEAAVKAAGIEAMSSEGWSAVEALARGLGLGDFRQTLEKLAVYALSADAPLGADDVAAVAPATREAALDDVIDAVAAAKPSAIGPLLVRLGQQGVAPVTLCLAAQRHFRALYAAAIHAQGPAQGLAAQRPPVFGPRRDRMIAQVRAWGQDRLEFALRLLIETDLVLRSTSRAPQMAVIERALIRLAMLPRQN
ncbi:MAG: DNA polymerase III subunit delta [Pseudomonadota bacterium]